MAQAQGKDGKRRLPVLKTSRSEPGGGEEADPERPPWQWVGFGAVAIFTAWLPLSAVSGAVAARLAASAADDGARLAGLGVVIVALHAGALAAGACAGGFIVGRWGGPRVGVREAALAGLVAAAAAIGAAWIATGVSAGALFVAAVAVPSAAAGGWQGWRVRARAP